jgi:hypothetical protein
MALGAGARLARTNGTPPGKTAELIAEHLAARDEEVAGIPAGERQRRPKIDELPAIRAARSAR